LACLEGSTATSTATFYERWFPKTCTDCPVAKYQSSSLSSDCVDCPAAKYQEYLGALGEEDCIPCPKGKYGTEPYGEASECVLCDRGLYSNEVAVLTTCAGACPPGKFREQSVNPADHDSAEDCLICGEKQYQNSDRADRCLGCPGAPDPMLTDPPTLNIDCQGCKPGQYKECSDANCVSGTCKNCDFGRFTDAVDEVTCAECPRGYYGGPPAGAAQEFGSLGCEGCPPGRHGKDVAVVQRTSETNVCEDCGPGKYNSAIGAIDGLECKQCVVGRYNEVSGSTGAAACKPCL
jgi:hypothetical protein